MSPGDYVQRGQFVWTKGILWTILASQHVQLGAQGFPLEDGGRGHSALAGFLLLGRLPDQVFRADHLFRKIENPLSRAD